MTDEGWVECVVALGTNQGDREDIAFRALADLRATEGFRVVSASSLYETVALGPQGPKPEAPGYLNQVIVMKTAWSAAKTLDALMRIERDHGRTREGVKFADRTLDLDLIVYGDVVSDDPHLTSPHPRAHERRFVLQPWLEISPLASIPGKGPIRELLESLPADTP